jgi:hypothetical protein
MVGVTSAATRSQGYGNRGGDMEEDVKKVLTRREVLAKALVGVTAVILCPLFSNSGRENAVENSIENVSNRDASFYRRLAG